MDKEKDKMNRAKYFVFVDKGARFSLNGNEYVKQSTRTARMLANGRVFYFRSNEQVSV